MASVTSDHGFLHSCRASRPLDWYQFILLDNTRGAFVNNLSKVVTLKWHGQEGQYRVEVIILGIFLTTMDKNRNDRRLSET